MAFPLVQKFIEIFKSMSHRQRQTFLFTLVAVIGFILIGIGLLAVIGPSQFETFESKSNGFSIRYLKSWVVRTGLPGVVVGFVSPRESDLDVFQENVTVIVQDLSDNPQTLNKYVQIAEMQIRGLFKDQIEVKFSGPTLVAGMTGHKLFYKGVNQAAGDLNLEMEHVMFIKDNKAYQLTYAAIISKFDKYASIFENMVKSFKFK